MIREKKYSYFWKEMCCLKQVAKDSWLVAELFFYPQERLYSVEFLAKKQNYTSISICELTQKCAKILSALLVKTKKAKIHFLLDEG